MYNFATNLKNKVRIRIRQKVFISFLRITTRSRNGFRIYRTRKFKAGKFS
ncbi:hypothetical protein NUACC21_55560 [Scytonema sp. NUACC21]